MNALAEMRNAIMDVPVWPCGVHVLLAAVGAAVFSLFSVKSCKAIMREYPGSLDFATRYEAVILNACARYSQDVRKSSRP